jgi:GntR family transcriptional regulator, trigonelline degradation regulator
MVRKHARRTATPTTTEAPSVNFRVNREDQSLRTMAVTSLRKAIFSLHFKPGEKLTERALCELTGVSRSLMREVLRDLEAHGLIANTPHRSPVVTTLTRSDARDIYEVRSALEPMAARLFVERATDDQIIRLNGVAERCSQAMNDKNVLALIDALESFYNMLFEGAGNRTAATLARTLHSKESLLRAITFQRQTDADTKQSMKQIERIAAAIRARNGEAAASACLTQVKRSRKVAMLLLDDLNDR